MAGSALEVEFQRIACTDCKTEFKSCVFGDGEFRLRACALCPACQDKRQKAEAQVEAAEQARNEHKAFERVCPPLYRDTRADHADILPAALDLIRRWDPLGSRGLGLSGTSGRCKTRLMYLALRRAIKAGKTVEAISHNAFSLLVQRAFAGDEPDRSRAAERLRQLRSTNVILLDDVGKAPRTERADAELEELVEHFVSHLKPILWTANGSAKWLEKRLGDDRGPALVRRLSEFAEVMPL